ncbi:SE-domain-containing protein [Microstroma glucosiphilum]|uniref:Squalene monooxygenase n=1 Tax=Pseudomicrostroma glucosiphilum TaxID=1684307 RepID=A0A316U829_9BASI|nr:SE-domain-containing protein [Pseudomicrostroma glucosiphilum]PWN20523.1 SE-domain-containing protein [Pseudomicrostroma glucosiphilum]
MASASSPTLSSSAAPLAQSPLASRPTSYDFVIVGAGVVGSALAFSLARSGRTVCLLERDLSKPDRIVGELLQPGGVRALSLLGLGDCLEGIDAIPVEGYQVFYGPRSVPIGYPVEDESEKGLGVESVTGKVEGRSFHHGNFVDALRKRALAQPGVTLIEATVKDIVTNASGVIAGVIATEKQSSSSAAPSTLRIEGSVTVVADGCFSKFRKTHGSSIAPTVRSNFVALELIHAPLPAPYHGHVVLSPSGPILLYQISTEHTRILIDVPGEKLPSVSKGELQAHIRDKVIPSLPEKLRPCVSKTLESGQRLRSMPNSFLPPSMQGQTENRKGVIVVGDAMNMRHPLTGGGMSVGLWDCVHLTRALGGARWSPPLLASEQSQPKDVTASAPVDLHAWSHSIRPALRSWHWSRKPLASVINILAQALYSLFGADDEALAVLREGCFKYFEMGGECVAGPVGLLSGLRPRPTLLVYHFFKVALFSIWCLFAHPRAYASRNGEIVRKPGIAEYPSLAFKSLLVFYTACVVILPVIWTELKANAPTFEDVTSSSALDASLRGSDGLNDGAFHDLLDRVNSSLRHTRKSGYMNYLPLPKRYLA